MERTGATPIGRRKRTDDNVITANGGTNGCLTPEERNRIVQAYSGDANGELLIGLRGQERVLIALLPPMADSTAAIRQTTRAATQLRHIGCDGYIFVRRARITGCGASSPLLLVIDISIGEHRRQTAVSMTMPAAPWGGDFVADTLGTAMADAWGESRAALTLARRK